MVLCFIALPVFAILAIFSVKYRKLTKESLECLFKTVTLGKCQSGLDDRIKSKISGGLLKFSPKSARFFYKNYKVISFILLIIFIWSVYVGGVGIYNYIEYGNCNGPDDDGFCILDPLGENSATCAIPGSVEDGGDFVYPVVNLEEQIIGNENAELTIIEFGCYTCEYTNRAEETVQEVLEYYGGKVNLQFVAYPIPGHEFSYESSLAVKCADEQEKYSEYHDKLFMQNLEFDNETFSDIALELGLDIVQFEFCVQNQTYKAEIEEDKSLAIASGVKGTPTFFIGEQQIVGPKPFKTFKKIINEEMDNVRI